MQNTIIIDADIKKESFLNEPTVTASDDITFVVNIKDDGLAFDLTDVVTFSLVNTRQDKTTIVTTGTKTGLNQVTFILGTNETAVAGKVKAVVQLYDADERVSTLSFSYKVNVDPTGEGFIPSASEQTLIQIVLGDGPLIIEEAQTAAEYANTQGDYALQVAVDNETRFLTAVSSVALRDSTYPDPFHGDTVRVTDVSKTYRYIEGSGWVVTDEYNPTAIDNVNVRVDEVNSQLADIVNRNALSPDSFSGTDLQKVQAAFNAALPQKRSIILDRVYDITGGTININKAADFREPTYILGLNFGGIKKTDGGFMFTSSNFDVSDFVFQNCYFLGDSLVSVKVFDCSKLIRLQTDNCYFNKITTIMYTDDTRYLQSIRMTGDTIVNCYGAALDFAGAYDTVLTNVIMEKSSGSFINHRAMGANPAIYGFRIRDCAIEGLTGTSPAIYFKTRVDSLLIEGCYFELNNGGHIVFDSLSTLYSVNINNNRHGGPVDVPQLIVWGRSCRSCYSHNNIAENIGIHDTTNVLGGRIYSVMDKIISLGADNNTTSVIDYIKYTEDSWTSLPSIGGYKTVFGQFTRITSKLTAQTIQAGSTITYTFDFLEPIYLDDMISLQIISENKKIVLNNYYRTGNTVKAIITNNEATAYTIANMVMCVLKMRTLHG